MPHCTLTAPLGGGFVLTRSVSADGGVSIGVTDAEGALVFSEDIAGGGTAPAEPDAAEQAR